jgi:predicted nucleic acid-binding protein
VIAVDTSVAVAATVSWHEAHDAARTAATGSAIPVHARLESYSVLTRLPAPHRLAPEVAAELLQGWFPAARVLVPDASLATSLVERLAAIPISGSAVYDALVGLTAADHGVELVTRDRRAARTYEALGVAHRVLP